MAGAPLNSPENLRLEENLIASILQQCVSKFKMEAEKWDGLTFASFVFPVYLKKLVILQGDSKTKEPQPQLIMG